MQLPSGIQNRKSKYLEQSLIVISNKIYVHYDKNIKKYVKTHPANNIHERNRSAVKVQGMNYGLTADTHPYVPFQGIAGTS